MKKTKNKGIGVVALLAVGSGVAFASASYTLGCGKTVISVDQEFLETYGEWESWVQDLNEVHCGSRDISLIEDRGDNYRV